MYFQNVVVSFVAEVDPTTSEKGPPLETGDPSLPVAIERAVEQGIGNETGLVLVIGLSGLYRYYQMKEN